MWSRSFLRPFGGQPRLSDPENRNKRRFDKRHASSSSSEKSTHRNSPHQQNTSSVNTPKTSWWSQQQAAIGNAVAGMGAAWQRIRPKALEVRVDVDMIRPTIMSARKTAEDTWAKVPPPVQTAAPYVGVAFLSAWLMNRIDQRTIRAQKRLNAEQELEIVALRGANEALQQPRSIYKDGMGEYVTSMTAAVAQATASAARAAEAAAVASESCAMHSRRNIRPVQTKLANQSSGQLPENPGTSASPFSTGNAP